MTGVTVHYRPNYIVENRIDLQHAKNNTFDWTLPQADISEIFAQPHTLSPWRFLVAASLHPLARVPKGRLSHQSAHSWRLASASALVQAKVSSRLHVGTITTKLLSFATLGHGALSCPLLGVKLKLLPQLNLLRVRFLKCLHLALVFLLNLRLVPILSVQNGLNVLEDQLLALWKNKKLIPILLPAHLLHCSDGPWNIC